MSIRGDIESGEYQPQECNDPAHQPQARKGKRFPHASEVLIPEQEFNIKGNWLCLYSIRGKGHTYAMFWADDIKGPALAYHEILLHNVFKDLARLMNCWSPRSGR